MASIQQFKLPGRNEEIDICFYSDVHYRLANGERMSVPMQAAWCRSCRDFVAAEYLESVEELRNEIAETREPDEDFMRKMDFFGTTEQAWIDRLEQQLCWRSTRESPARCLTCQGDDIVSLPTGDEVFQHPDTGEPMVFDTCMFASMESEWHAEFTPEGELISSYWK